MYVHIMYMYVVVCTREQHVCMYMYMCFLHVCTCVDKQFARKIAFHR